MSSSTPPSGSAVRRFLSGFLAALIPFLTLVGAATLVSSSQGEQITSSEWIGAVVAALVAVAAIDARQVGPAVPAAPALIPPSADTPA